MTPSESGRRLLARGFRQPDQRSCGAAVAVIAEGLVNDAYARRLVDGGQPLFDAEVTAMHRRLTGPVAAGGRLQLPWWRAVGTPPWALARQLGRRTGRYRVRAVQDPHDAWRDLVDGVAIAPTALYVGQRWTPRHVVLAVVSEPGDAPEAIGVYEPGSGQVVRVTRADWLARRARIGGWSTPWWVLSPRLSPQGPRTPA